MSVKRKRESLLKSASSNISLSLLDSLVLRYSIAGESFWLGTLPCIPRFYTVRGRLVLDSLGILLVLVVADLGSNFPVRSKHGHWCLRRS